MRHYVPLAFVLAIVIPAVAAVFWKPAVWAEVVAVGLYLLVMGSVSGRLARGQNAFRTCHVLAAFVSLHIPYGVGLMVGFLRIPFLKKDK